MGNASKAILMAGAVLIAVMLISLTIYFFNALKNYNSNMNSQEKMTQIESFNRFFTFAQPSNNGRITGADMINIMGKIRDYSKVYQDPDYTFTVTINANIHFSDPHLSTIPNPVTATDNAWAQFIEYAKNSNDALLYTNAIVYEYDYNNTGRITIINFSR